MKKFKREPIYKYATTCCSLTVISAKAYHTLKELKDLVDYQKEEAFSQSFLGTDNFQGQRNIMCIVSPGEDNLEKNLKKLNFKLLADNMPRRTGYPAGLLKMYLLSF